MIPISCVRFSTDQPCILLARPHQWEALVAHALTVPNGRPGVVAEIRRQTSDREGAIRVTLPVDQARWILEVAKEAPAP